MIHCENLGHRNISEKLLSDGTLGDEVTLCALRDELMQLDEKLLNIQERRFCDLKSKYIMQYKYKYPTPMRPEISTEDCQFFISHLDPQAKEETVTAWVRILHLREALPPLRTDQYARLNSVVYKRIDQNKQVRVKLQKLILALSPTTSIDKKNYIIENLVGDKESIREMVEKFSIKEVTKKERSQLRKRIPSSNYGDTEAIGARIKGILLKLIDISGKGANILYPRQVKAIKNAKIHEDFEAESLTKQRLNQLLTDPAICPSIDEFFAIIKLLDDNDTQNDVSSEEDIEDIDFSVVIIDILEKIISALQSRLFNKWQGRIGPNPLSLFLDILNDHQQIRPRWHKVLNNELPYPILSEFCMDVSDIKRHNPKDAKQFVRLTGLLTPVVCPLPIANSLVKKLLLSGEQPPLTQPDQNDKICAIALEEIDQLHRLINTEIYDRRFLDSLMKDKIVPKISKQISFLSKKNPSYAKFIHHREQLLARVKKRGIETGKPQPFPEAQIRKLYQDVVHISEDDNTSKQQLFENMSLSLKKAYSDQNTIELPNRVKNNVEFRLALEFHLVRLVSLLKIIKKFSQTDDAEFLFANYTSVIKCRNQLAHGDYVRELFDKKTDELTSFLLKVTSGIRHDIEQIRNRLTLNDATGHEPLRKDDNDSQDTLLPDKANFAL